jgi:ankyrin repeat protein
MSLQFSTHQVFNSVLICQELTFASDEQDGKTPLHMAAEAGNTEGVDFLLHQGADKTVPDWVSAKIERVWSISEARLQNLAMRSR